MAVDLNSFYSQETVDEWRQIIGDELHYHFGYSSGPNDIEGALRQTVRNFYPYIPHGSRILHVGCGWGGPALMLIKERHCTVQGLAFGATQADYCRSIGLDVWQSNIETDPIQGEYDIVFMHEVLSHIRAKETLLGRLRAVAPRLIVTMNCRADTCLGTGIAFDGSMEMISPAEFVAMVERAGWRILFQQNRRFQSLPTILYWKKNLDRIYGQQAPPGQLGTLRNMVETALQAPARWCQLNPLIDIVAEAET